MRTAVTANESQAVKGVLTLGFLALGMAVIAAYTSPAEGYELSIYAATPVATWLALAAVAVVSISVVLYDQRYLPLAVLLGGLGAATVVGLPLIRGYHFYGRADSLVHLGLTRSINVGNDPLVLFYPGGHLVAASLAKVAGIGITRAMMLFMWLSVLLFYAAVSLCVWFLVPDRRALAAGAFSAFLLLPINNVSTYIHFHTYSIAMLFVPLVLYFLFSHLIDGSPRERGGDRVGDGGSTMGRGSGFGDGFELGVGQFRTVPTSVLLPLASVALVLFHPQVALNVLILLGGISVTQHVFRRYRPSHSITEYRLLTVQTAFLLLVFVVWVVTHDWQFVRTAESMIASTTEFVAGTASTTPRVESQADSAAAIGTSIWELFAKLFGVGAVYALLAAGAVLGRVTGLLGRLNTGQSFRSAPDTGRDLTTLVFAGTLALLPFFALHLVGSISTYLFRHVGFLMMLATIFGAVGVRYLLWTDSPGGDSTRQPVGTRAKSTRKRLAAGVPAGRTVMTVVVVLLLLSLSLATVFPSPFVHLSGSHVPEGEMDGYEQAFVAQPAGSPVWFGGVRHTSDRYEVALYGAESAPWERQVVPSPKKSAPVPENAMLTGLPAYYATHPEEIVRRDHYFVVAAADRQREVDAYSELRYSAESFAAVEAQPDVAKVRDNGELTVYFVDIQTEPSQDATDEGE